MKSIRGGFALHTFITIVMLSVLLGSISVLTLVRRTDRDAAAHMNLLCANEAASMDTLLEGIEDAVDVEVSYVRRILASDEGQAALAAVKAGEQSEEAFEGQLLAEAARLFDTIAEKTNGALVYYVRLDGSAVTDRRPAGFICVRASEDKPFHAIPFAEYGRELPGEDAEADVGWDSKALRSGTSLWLEPYRPEGSDVFMASYVEPLIIDGVYAGIVGMGVNFNVIMDSVAAIKAYDNGYAFLTDADENVMYHPTIPYGTNLASGDDQDVPEVDAAIAAGTTTDDVVTYRYNGQDKRMAFHLLQNDMRLALSVDAAEIYSDRNRLVIMLVVASAVSAIGFVILSLQVGSRLLEPLDELSAAAARVAKGDLDVNILASDTEELTSLVSSYQKTVADLRDQISFINDLARTDALTGLLNANAFSETVVGIDQQLAGGETDGVCVVMLDVNDLKPINDTYGHEAGDALLRNAAQLIAESFESCLAYRIGGDEFVVVLSGALADEAQAGMARLQERCAALCADESLAPEERVSIAAGMAAYDPARDRGIADVRARADAAMYANKQALKAQRTR